MQFSIFHFCMIFFLRRPKHLFLGLCVCWWVYLIASKLAFSVKALKDFVMIIFFSLIVLVSQLLILFFFLAGSVQLICWSRPVVPNVSVSSVDCIAGLVLLPFCCVFIIFVMTVWRQSLQICFLFLRSFNSIWSACVTSVSALGWAIFCSFRRLSFWSHVTNFTLKNDSLTLKLSFLYFNSKR